MDRHRQGKPRLLAKLHFSWEDLPSTLKDDREAGPKNDREMFLSDLDSSSSLAIRYLAIEFSSYQRAGIRM